MLQHYIVLLRKGPTWAPGDSPEFEELQQRHLAYIRIIHEGGRLLVAGPTDAHFESDLRGISIFHADAFTSPEELIELVEGERSIQAGRLRAEYALWYHQPFLEAA